ncbi:hypothetical protein PG994_008694 [Apiospora phragmitis]|uniref:Nitronate monooxygenase domain-containing protein n=1 Tax=Apiospora phragmitis TaxID=2905665 RepID=A0ABR1UH60_9PEZI
MSPSVKLATPLTALLGIQHPIMLAGMDMVAGPEPWGCHPRGLSRSCTKPAYFTWYACYIPSGSCQAGADIICAQGGEAGGHTGDIQTSILTPACVDIVKQYKSPLTGNPVLLVTGGGVNDGRSLASALMLGASGVWVGTRFTAAVESKYPESAKKEVINATYDSWVRSLIWSGRPLRALRTPYIDDWEANRQGEIRDLTARGLVPLEHELDRLHREGKLTEEIEEQAALRPIGIVAGAVNKPGQTVAEIVKEMVDEAAELLGAAPTYLTTSSKL